MKGDAYIAYILFDSQLLLTQVKLYSKVASYYKLYLKRRNHLASKNRFISSSTQQLKNLIYVSS